MADTPIAIGTAPLPVELPSPPAAETTAQEESRANMALPPVTTGTSEHYAQGLAAAVSRASATNPLTIMFQGEKLPPGQSIADLDTASIERLVYDAATARLATKLAHGAFVAEAAGFAAVACWEPGRAGESHRTDQDVLAERPIFAMFLDRWTDLMRRCLYPLAQRVSGGRYWKLSLMARDPAVPYVPGAVRAVLVPFMDRFTSDENEGGAMPVWLEAGSERARDVYAHFGFRDVGEIEVEGVKTWGMIYTGNIRIEDTNALQYP
ncbi:hypothetical protein F4677DRAFT_449588 [Hypoxylon crocopeplum]|nr:hypothetical protein F4677DRAFT_449588 [Hypoxylon crocopeplum]